MSIPLGTVEARYSGYCEDCGERYQPGTLIRTERAEGGMPVWVHASCDPEPTLPPGVTEACQTCFLLHPKGGCDRE